MDALLIFAKNPILGKVKTRLAESIGQEEALGIYKSLLFYTFDIADNLSCYKIACFNELDQFILEAIPFDESYTQEGRDLGAKMNNAIQFAKIKGFQKIIVIGTDCADLDETIIKKAFDSLDNHDFVIGPALDGGYYLIGMKEANSKVFESIAWSTDAVLEQTVQAIEQQTNKKYQLLETLSDIDTLEDLKASKNPIFSQLGY